MPNTGNRIKDESADHQYFVVRPRLVWAMARDPYDIVFWEVVKEIAGDHGECFVSTEHLSKLSKMSVGKAVKCRSYLIEVGLLKGYIKKDPGYSQGIWHLSVPDIWKRNVEWAEKYPKIEDRINWVLENKPSPGEGSVDNFVDNSVDNLEPSPHEGLPSPHEGLPSPHEGKPSPGVDKEYPSSISKENPKKIPLKGTPQEIWIAIVNNCAANGMLVDPNHGLDAVSPRQILGDTLYVMTFTEEMNDWFTRNKDEIELAGIEVGYTIDFRYQNINDTCL